MTRDHQAAGEGRDPSIDTAQRLACEEGSRDGHHRCLAETWSVFDGGIVAAPGGGVSVPWGESQEDTSETRVVRHGEDGSTWWSWPPVGFAPRDAAWGADCLLDVLRGDLVHLHVL